jgi:hypothetical protein
MGNNRQSGVAKMALGAFIFFIFGAIAVASVASAMENGGVYFIWYGPVIGGVYIFYKGLRQFLKGNDNSRTALNQIPSLTSYPITFSANATAPEAGVTKIESKFCIYCGSRLKENAKFCGKCGKKLKKDSVQSKN